MRLDVKRIMHTPGQQLPFQFTMDLSALDFYGLYPVDKPVEVEGRVRNTAGVLELTLVAHSVLDTVCDRCMKPLSLSQAISYSCVLAEEKQDEENEEIVLLKDGQVDVEDLARTAFILEMDTKILCSEDCQGLCSRCGADLNLGPCSCQREVDPRLAALAKLLDKDSDQQ